MLFRKKSLLAYTRWTKTDHNSSPWAFGLGEITMYLSTSQTLRSGKSKIWSMALLGQIWYSLTKEWDQIDEIKYSLTNRWDQIFIYQRMRSSIHFPMNEIKYSLTKEWDQVLINQRMRSSIYLPKNEIKYSITNEWDQVFTYRRMRSSIH